MHLDIIMQKHFNKFVGKDLFGGLFCCHENGGEDSGTKRKKTKAYGNQGA